MEDLKQVTGPYWILLIGFFFHWGLPICPFLVVPIHILELARHTFGPCMPVLGFEWTKNVSLASFIFFEKKMNQAKGRQGKIEVSNVTTTCNKDP
jgi:hypothetical protein